MSFGTKCGHGIVSWLDFSADGCRVPKYPPDEETKHRRHYDGRCRHLEHQRAGNQVVSSKLEVGSAKYQRALPVGSWQRPRNSKG
jgi:hypothetical protein